MASAGVRSSASGNSLSRMPNTDPPDLAASLSEQRDYYKPEAGGSKVVWADQ